MPFSAGNTLLHYRLIRKLGAGGMGEVYLADDTRLKRQVAIKLLSAALVHGADFLALFRREAEAAARLNHPAIATIHALEETADTTFIVMEYVEGQPPCRCERSRARSPRMHRSSSRWSRGRPFRPTAVCWRTTTRRPERPRSGSATLPP